MSFLSIAFLLFLLATAAVYFLVPGKYRWVVLLVASYIFYAISGVKYLAYILLTTVTTYFAGRFIHKEHRRIEAAVAELQGLDRKEKKAFRTKQGKRLRLVAAGTMVLNFGILIFIKAFNIIAPAIVTARAEALGLVPGSLPSIVLPLGISFYTFQCMGYIIDLKRGKYAAADNFLHFALFSCYFPQLVQGPVNRYDKFAHQLIEPHDFDVVRIRKGLQLMLWGFFQTMVMAARLSPIVDTVYGNYQSFAGMEIVFSVFASGFCTYMDFAGGINIALGASQIFGITMAENFKRPYFAETIRTFWDRWHISLTSFIQNYIYVPLATTKAMVNLTKFGKKHLGNFGKMLPTCCISYFTFLILGIWHATSIKYIAYGIYNATILLIESMLEPSFKKLNKKLGIPKEHPPLSIRVFRMVRTQTLWAVSMCLTWSNTVADFGRMFARIFTGWNWGGLFSGFAVRAGSSPADMCVLAFGTILVFIVGVLQERGVHIRDWLAEQGWLIRCGAALAALAIILIFGFYGPGYDAGAFVYQNF